MDRLTFECLKQFYYQSASTEYWVKEFFTPMVEARRENFYTRAEYLVSYFGKDRDGRLAILAPVSVFFGGVAQAGLQAIMLLSLHLTRQRYARNYPFRWNAARVKS